MAVKQIESSISVVEATYSRIENLFKNGTYVYLSFSSGKDSLCMADITYKLILQGRIDAKKLIVCFIDEEGLYPSMVDAAYRWRKKFLSVGARFWWFCLPLKQACVIDSLQYSESWITWESSQRDKWMREPPPFAIMSHLLLKYEGEMNYQTFMGKIQANGIAMVGSRMAESLTRRGTIARSKLNAISTNHTFYPIYDWKDNDIWLYIKENNLEFPEVYMHLYEKGVAKQRLRLCAFFGDCGMQGLRHIAETDSQLWERILKRQPNAELALLYWDSEMFGRNTAERKRLEKDQEKINYIDYIEDCLFKHPERYTIQQDTQKNIPHLKAYYIKYAQFVKEDPKQQELIYKILTLGDPKSRSMQGLYQKLTEYLKKEGR